MFWQVRDIEEVLMSSCRHVVALCHACVASFVVVADVAMVCVTVHSQHRDIHQQHLCPCTRESDLQARRLALTECIRGIESDPRTVCTG
jgi:hypothetical protein